MTYPFGGTIKVEKIKDENDNDKIVWDYSQPIVGPYTICTNSNERMRLSGDLRQMYIGTPDKSEKVQLDPDMNLNIGTHTDAYGEKYEMVFSKNTEWAHVDKDLNLTYLDMDLCAKGPHNAYTALAVGIWNAAIEEAAKQVDHILSVTHATQGDVIRELKK